MRGSHGMVRVAAVADIHCTRVSQGALQPLFRQVNESADVLLICGDLTDYGLPEEARVVAEEVSAALKIPVVAVLGNHDYETGAHHEIHHILSAVGVTVLDGDACEIAGIGFAGVKGFGGGFGGRSLQPWGEEAVKHFVRETVEEALKLESALARLETAARIANVAMPLMRRAFPESLPFRLISMNVDPRPP
jgi:Icc-related predicted phosphoesterase